MEKLSKKSLTIISAVLAAALILVGVLYFLNASSNKTTVDGLNNIVNDLSAKLDAQTAEIEALNTDLKGKSSEIEALTTDLESKSSEVEALTTDLESKSSEVEALTTDLESKSSEIEALTTDLESKSSEIEALNTELEGRKSEIADLNADLAAKDDAIADLSDILVRNADPEIPDSIPGVYASTREFLYELEQANFTYEYYGLDEDNDDAVVVPLSCSGHDIRIIVWFSEDCSRTYIRVWDVIAFTDADRSNVIHACNTLNSAYRYVCFYADSDNTVSASMDLIYQDHGGQSAFESIFRVYSILSDAYPTLEPFAK